jgi:hypothetical protein
MKRINRRKIVVKSWKKAQQELSKASKTGEKIMVIIK